MASDPKAVLRDSLPTTEQQARFDALYNQQAKRQGVANILSLPILGTFGLQHFYLGKYFSGILSILFSWTLIPTVVSLFELISGEVRHEVQSANKKIAKRIHATLVTDSVTAPAKVSVVEQVAAAVATMTPGAIVEPIVAAPPQVPAEPLVATQSVVAEPLVPVQPVVAEPLVPDLQPQAPITETVSEPLTVATPSTLAPEEIMFSSSTVAEMSPEPPVLTPPLKDVHHYADAEPLLDTDTMSDSGDPSEAEGVLLFVAEEDPLDLITVETVSTPEGNVIVTVVEEEIFLQQRPVVFDPPPSVPATTPSQFPVNMPHSEVSQLVDNSVASTSPARPAHETGWVDVSPLHTINAHSQSDNPPTDPTNVPGGGLGTGTSNPPTNVPGGDLGTGTTPAPLTPDDPDYRPKPPHLGTPEAF